MRSLVSPALATTLAAGVVLSGSARAQFAERPDLPGSGSAAVDCSGRSIKNPRIRAIHTTDPALQGGTAWLFERDPFLAYQLGRNLNFREFRERDGVFDTRISNLGGPMPDGTTAKITANNQVSCSGCHNLPQGNPGGGVTFHKDSGFGRNSPHYYGAGIVEMLALQVRDQMLRQIDRDGNGWVSASEARRARSRVRVRPGQGFGPVIDFGSAQLSNGTTGSPGFNNIVRVWYVDANGQHVRNATQVDGQTTHGYNFALTVWGWGQGPGRTALNPTNRAFLWDPFKAHSGLESHDPSTLDDPDGDGVSEPTLAGAVQFPATHRAPDAGTTLDPLGFSRDDPDGDGYLEEISEGDLDVGEWFMLNAPRPAFAGTSSEYERGVQLLESMRCTECHVADWTIRGRRRHAESGAGSRFAGDRRFFDLDVQWDATDGRLEGRLVPLYDLRNGEYRRRFRSFTVRGLFTDLRHHDMGAGFEEIDFGGTKNRIWRTPPLWGVGSGFPWGHDGQSLTLDDAIRRHDGEGSASRQRYDAATPVQRAELLDFLRKLVLYDVEALPTDIDGDNAIASSHMVAGQDTGLERFNAEWLFRIPAQIQGPFRNIDGELVRSFAVRNVTTAYGLDLALRLDGDLDGWPDVWDNAPTVPGYRDGVR